MSFIPVFLNDNILVLSLPSLTQTNTISLPASSGPYGASILPNSQKLYIANYTTNSVSVIDLATETVINNIALEPPFQANAGVFWLAATPDSKKVFIISQYDPIVIPLDTATDTIGTPFSTTNQLFYDLVISPDPAPVAAFDTTPQFIGTPTEFNASASLSPIGTIVSYAWDFGDGHTAVTASPYISHTYLTVGTFNVTLTVTNSAGTSTTQVFSSGYMNNNGGPAAQITHLVPAFAIPPPSNAYGYQTYCHSHCHTILTNMLFWSSPAGGYDPAAYFIFRDEALSQFIGAVPANNCELQFKDTGRKKKIYTYYIVTVSSEGTFSAPIEVIVNPIQECHRFCR